MWQDEGIPERQKVRKQGRDDRTKQWSIQSPYISFFIIHVHIYMCIWNKISVGGLYTSLFCAIIPTLFPYFLPFWYPYILSHFQMFFITCKDRVAIWLGHQWRYETATHLCILRPEDTDAPCRRKGSDSPTTGNKNNRYAIALSTLVWL